MFRRWRYIYSSVLHTVLLYPVYVVASTVTCATCCTTANILAPTHSFRYFKLWVRLCVSQRHEPSASLEGIRTPWYTASDNGFKKCIAFCVCECKNTACVRRLLSQALIIQYTPMSAHKTKWPAYNALLPLNGLNCQNYRKQPSYVISIASSESGL
jgi:hypothetical protein